MNQKIFIYDKANSVLRLNIFPQPLMPAQEMYFSKGKYKGKRVEYVVLKDPKLILNLLQDHREDTNNELVNYIKYCIGKFDERPIIDETIDCECHQERGILSPATRYAVLSENSALPKFFCKTCSPIRSGQTISRLCDLTYINTLSMVTEPEKYMNWMVTGLASMKGWIGKATDGKLMSFFHDEEEDYLYNSERWTDNYLLSIGSA